METIHDTPDETVGVRTRRSWAEKRLSRRESAPIQKPRGKPFSREADWRAIALISAGLAAGLVLGAGLALLVAPQSGEHTRLALSQELRRRRPWRKSSWERLGEEFRDAARFGRNRLRSSGTTDTL